MGRHGLGTGVVVFHPKHHSRRKKEVFVTFREELISR